jgi:hypothetical protein
VRQRLTLFVLSLSVSLIPGLVLADGPLDDTGRKVFAWFERQTSSPMDDFLRVRTPPRLDAASVANVLKSLPPKGERQPTAADRPKLLAIQRVLDYIAGPGAVRVALTAELDDAYVGLYYRAVLIVSMDAMKVLDERQLAAIAAHELGHSVDWDEYLAAIQGTDLPRMRELELRSDGMAVLYLAHLGRPAKDLVSALQALERYNAWHGGIQAGRTGGPPSTVARYPTLDARIAFIRAVAGLEWARGPAARVAVVPPSQP